MINYRIIESDNGQLALYNSTELLAQPVMPVLAFPFSSPTESISIVDEYSKEMLWLDNLNQLEETSRHVIQTFLKRREFRPKIQRITGVSTYSTPSLWSVETDVGPYQFELPSEESIRRLNASRLILTHSNGMQFVIENMRDLDAKSRQILARFMA